MDPDDRAARWFVGCVGGALAILLLGFAAIFGNDIPHGDCFEVVPVLTGDRAPSAAWLWESSLGHRVFLRKILLVGLDLVTGHPFRVATFLNVLLLAAAALLCVAAARRLRGSTRYLDAVFPLLLLNPGWGRYLLDASLLTGYLRPALLCGVLYVASGFGSGSPIRTLRNIALCAVALAACLTTGLLAALPVLAWAALRTRGLPGDFPETDRRDVLVVRGALAAAIFYLVLYLPGLSLGHIPFGDQGAGRVLGVSLQALGQGFGPAGALGWRENRMGLLESGAPPLLSLAALALVLVPVALLFVRRGDGDRLRREGFAVVSAACLVVAVSTGFGRAAGEGEPGLRVHYGLTAVPGIAAGLLLLPELLGEGRAAFLLHGAFALACALFTFNLQAGCRTGRDFRGRMAAFRADAGAGLDARALAERHADTLQWPRRELEGILEGMRRAHRTPFD